MAKVSVCRECGATVADKIRAMFPAKSLPAGSGPNSVCVSCIDKRANHNHFSRWAAAYADSQKRTPSRQMVSELQEQNAKLVKRINELEEILGRAKGGRNN